MLPTAHTPFLFIATAPTEIYTLSLHDALPILLDGVRYRSDETQVVARLEAMRCRVQVEQVRHGRSEEHTSELQSHSDLVCRLLLEKKNNGRRRADLYTFRDQGAVMVMLCGVDG